MEEERLQALEAAARARAEVSELTENRRKLQWQSKLLEKMSEVRGGGSQGTAACHRLCAVLLFGHFPVTVAAARQSLVAPCPSCPLELNCVVRSCLANIGNLSHDITRDLAAHTSASAAHDTCVMLDPRIPFHI